MNKLLLVFLLWSISVEVLADTKVDTTYDIKKAWVDDRNLYVLYQKVLTKVSYSERDINGTILGEKKSLHLTRFDRAKIGAAPTSLVEGGKLLGENEPQQLNINYYVDQEISIKEKDGITTLTLDGKQTQFHCDHKTWDDASVPVKLGERIFYCGYIFSAGGRFERLSKNVETKIQLIRDKTSWGWTYPLMYVADNNFLLIRSIQDKAAKILRVKVDSMEVEEITSPSFGKGNYWVMNKAVAYSTNSFVFGNGYAPPEVSLCTSDKCETVSSFPAYRYLVVDASSHVVYFIYQNLFTSPEIKIEVVKH